MSGLGDNHATRAQPKRATGAEPVSPEAAKWPIDKDFLQKDIDRAIDFMKEYYKYTLGISTALLAFTVSFPPNLSKVIWPNLIFAAWVGLGVAIISGVFAHNLWSHFFITWRNFDDKDKRDVGKTVRGRITWWRRKADLVQLLGLAIGVSCIVVFAGINIPNIAPKESKTAATTAGTTLSVPQGSQAPAPVPNSKP